MEVYVTRTDACFKAVRPGFKNGREDVFDCFQESVVKKLSQCVDAKKDFDVRNVLTQPVDRDLVTRVSALEVEVQNLTKELATQREAVAAAAVARLEEEFAQQDESSPSNEVSSSQDTDFLAEDDCADAHDEEETAKLALLRDLLVENCALKDSLAMMLPTVSSQLKDTIRAVAEGKVTEKSEVDNILLRAKRQQDSITNEEESSSSVSQAQKRSVNGAVRLARTVAAALKRPASVPLLAVHTKKVHESTKTEEPQIKKLKTSIVDEDESCAGSESPVVANESPKEAVVKTGVLTARPSSANSRTPPQTRIPSVWKEDYTSDRNTSKNTANGTPSRSRTPSKKSRTPSRRTPPRSAKMASTPSGGRSARKVRTPCLRV